MADPRGDAPPQSTLRAAAQGVLDLARDTDFLEHPAMVALAEAMAAGGDAPRDTERVRLLEEFWSATTAHEEATEHAAQTLRRKMQRGTPAAGRIHDAALAARDRAHERLAAARATLAGSLPLEEPAPPPLPEGVTLAALAAAVEEAAADHERGDIGEGAIAAGCSTETGRRARAAAAYLRALAGEPSPPVPPARLDFDSPNSDFAAAWKHALAQAVGDGTTGEG